MTVRVLITKLVRHVAVGSFQHMDDHLIPGTEHSKWVGLFRTGELDVEVVISVRRRGDGEAIVIPEAEAAAT